MSPLDRLTRGTAKIISAAELEAKLNLNRPLRVKLGVDPTSPDLHLGHTLILRKLRDFQELGHQAILIIGDFTALIGDPTGRSATRPQLSREEIERNAETYRQQAFMILDRDKTEVLYNSAWLAQLSFAEVLRLNSRLTLQQLLHREDFRARWEKQEPIHAHEIQYPVMQAWDSVMVRADVELGGSDQLFNILLGRDLQREEGQSQQIVMLCPILEGLDGVKKMSKSLGNYVALTEPPEEMFGKLMSISDELMAKYYRLLLLREIDPQMHPLAAKKKLAGEIVTTYYSPTETQRAEANWITRFSDRRLDAAALPEMRATTGDAATIVVAGFALFGVERSRSEAGRLIRQGSVQVDSIKVEHPTARLVLQPGQILRLDKRRAVRLV